MPDSTVPDNGSIGECIHGVKRCVGCPPCLNIGVNPRPHVWEDAADGRGRFERCSGCKIEKHPGVRVVNAF